MKLYCQIHSFGNSEELHQSPLIFLHGLAFSGNMFVNVAPILAEKTKRKAYVPDMRNHGKSSWVNELDYDVMVEDILELMQQNSIPKAILIGASMGGRIAQILALKYPNKVEALVIEDMTPRDVVSTGDTVVKVMYRGLIDILSTLTPDMDVSEAKRICFESLGSYVLNTKKVKFDEVDIIPIVKENDTFRTSCNLDIINTTMLEKDALVQNLPNLGITYEGDTIFIYGSNGFFDLDEDPSIKKLFPKAIIKRIEDAFHFVHIDSPEEFTNTISNFILHRNSPRSKY